MSKRHPEVEYQGIVATPIRHSRRLGLNVCIVYRRIAKYGTSPDALAKVFAPATNGRVYEYQGVRATLHGHAARLGRSWPTTYKRFHLYGDDPRFLDKVFAPAARRHLVTYDGIAATLAGHARRLGLAYCTVKRRAARFGLTEDALPLVFSSSAVVTRGRRLTFNGVTDSVEGWSRRIGINRASLDCRLRTMPVALALMLPRQGPGGVHNVKYVVTYGGETRTAAEWAARLGICKSGIVSRIRRGLPPDEILYPTKATRAGKRKSREYERCMKDDIRARLARLGIVV